MAPAPRCCLKKPRQGRPSGLGQGRWGAESGEMAGLAGGASPRHVGKERKQQVPFPLRTKKRQRAQIQPELPTGGWRADHMAPRPPVVRGWAALLRRPFRPPLRPSSRTIPTHPGRLGQPAAWTSTRRGKENRDTRRSKVKG